MLTGGRCSELAVNTDLTVRTDLTELCTVKLEDNNHPLDSKKVAVVQKVVAVQRWVQNFCFHICWVGDSGLSLLQGGR